MKKLIVLIAFLSMAGCKDFTSAKGVIGTAADAIKEGDYDLYLQTLTGDAAANYGNTEAFNNLKAQVSSYKKMKVSNVALTSRNGDFSYYSAEVVGTSSQSATVNRVATMSVDCESKTYYQPVTCHDNCYGYRYDYGYRCDQVCEGGYNYQQDYCLISKISL